MLGSLSDFYDSAGTPAGVDPRSLLPSPPEQTGATADVAGAARRALFQESADRHNDKTDGVWDAYLEALHDPSNPIDAQAITELTQQFIAEYGPTTQAPNPLRLLSVNVDDRHPEVKLARAREQVAKDPANPGGYEDRLRLGEDGNVDWSAYDARLKEDHERRASDLEAYQRLYDAETSALKEAYPLDPSSPNYDEARRNYLQREHAIRAQLQRDVLRREAAPAPEIPAGPDTPSAAPVVPQGVFRAPPMPGDDVAQAGPPSYLNPDQRTFSSKPPGGLRFK